MNYLVQRTALIDADFIAYEAAAWAHATQADVFDLTQRVEGTVKEWAEKACASKWIVMYSCSREENFRRDWYPLYKAHRTSEPPAMLDAAQQVIKDMSATVVYMPRLEADDVMGIAQTNGKTPNTVIVSVDKDMRQIPGWHCNPHKEDFPVFVTEDEADYLFYMQWLTGDATDGYGGIKGIGPAKARKILGPAGGVIADYEKAVLDAYEKADYDLTQAVGQARCARILRASDWNSEDRLIIPWTPGKVGGDG
jgi:DNA polymerase-1